MFCEKTMATEIKFTTALEQVDSFELRNNTLLLLADNKVIPSLFSNISGNIGPPFGDNYFLLHPVLILPIFCKYPYV